MEWESSVEIYEAKKGDPRLLIAADAYAAHYSGPSYRFPGWFFKFEGDEKPFGPFSSRLEAVVTLSNYLEQQMVRYVLDHQF